MVQDAYGLRATGLMKGVYVRGLGGEVTSEGAGDAGACISPQRLRVGGGRGKAVPSSLSLVPTRRFRVNDLHW